MRHNLRVMVSVMLRKTLKWQTQAYGHDKAEVVCLCTVTSRSKKFAFVCFGIRVCLGNSDLRVSGCRNLLVPINWSFMVGNWGICREDARSKLGAYKFRIPKP